MAKKKGGEMLAEYQKEGGSLLQDAELQQEEFSFALQELFYSSSPF